jgi:uncharacterized membrane protein
MGTTTSELLHLIARWVHLIAGIMWIGNSMLFNWLDRNLEMPDNAKKGLIGEIWMVHSGGFYQVEKKHLDPSQMPKNLHWFKWQNGITWLSGIALLILVYYMGGASLMTDPAVSRISGFKSVLVGVSTLVGAWLLYDVVWRSTVGKNPKVAFALSVLTVLLMSWVQFHYLSGRAAYMHVGVMLGTMMTGNVWFVIIPSQRELVAATMEGREQDPAIGYQAKQRSVHNNYMTFPLLFIMLSNHFPTTFGHAMNWLVLLVLCLGSALIRHLMNIRFTYKQWLFPATATFFATCVAMLVFFSHPQGFGKRVQRTANGHAPVVWDDVEPIFKRRCITCHSRYPTDNVYHAPPNGVVVEEYDDAKRWVARIKLRVVELHNMPLNNQTHITDQERATIGAWIEQGAKED